jgi:hypothetical protein
MATPPGWPAEVADPAVPEWERSATAWLFDQCPPDFRGYPVFSRHPLVLAHAARASLTAAIAATESALQTARHDLRGQVTPETVDSAIAAYERERHRLRGASTAAELVWRALRGERWTAKL